jgi:hypothetical protein
MEQFWSRRHPPPLVLILNTNTNAQIRQTNTRRIRYDPSVALSRCRVSFRDSDGIEHAVEVDAETLYEAVALAVKEFQHDEVSESCPPPMTEFTVTVFRKPTEHKIRLSHVTKWAQSTTREEPAGITKRERV